MDGKKRDGEGGEGGVVLLLEIYVRIWSHVWIRVLIYAWV